MTQESPVVAFFLSHCDPKVQSVQFNSPTFLSPTQAPTKGK